MAPKPNSFFSRFGRKQTVMPKAPEMSIEHLTVPEAIETEPTAPVTAESRKLSIPEQELVTLEKKLADLRLVEESLRWENSKSGEVAPSYRAETEVFRANKTAEAVSKEVIDTAAKNEGAITEEQRSRLASVRAEAGGAKDFLQEKEQFRTVEYEGARTLKEGALADKLKELGVTMSDGDGYHSDAVEAGIARRTTELRSEIWRKKLEIDGGLEEMVGGLVGREHFLPDAELSRVGESLKHAQRGSGNSTVARVYEDMKSVITRTDANWYPLEVQQGVLAHVVRKVVEGETEEVEAALQSYLKLDRAVQEQARVSNEAEQEIEKLKKEVTDITKQLEKIKELPDPTPSLRVDRSYTGNAEFDLLTNPDEGERDPVLWRASVPADVSAKFEDGAVLGAQQVKLTFEVAIQSRSEKMRLLEQEKTKLAEMQEALNAQGQKSISRELHVAEKQTY